MTNADQHIEAILFLEGEPVSVKKLAKILETEENDINDAVAKLEEKLKDRGIRLLKKDESVMLATAPESSDILKKLIKEEFNPELSKAALEVLAIVVYRGPLTRSDIDYIRGVNSAFTIRNLLIRGLVERISNPKDSRSFIYRPSFQLLQHFGIQKIEDLPEYNSLNEKMQEFIQDNENNDEDNKQEITADDSSGS